MQMSIFNLDGTITALWYKSVLHVAFRKHYFVTECVKKGNLIYLELYQSLWDGQSCLDHSNEYLDRLKDVQMPEVFSCSNKCSIFYGYSILYSDLEWTTILSVFDLSESPPIFLSVTGLLGMNGKSYVILPRWTDSSLLHGEDDFGCHNDVNGLKKGVYALAY